jgi:DNA-binding MltR family transcriptional regulator
MTKTTKQPPDVSSLRQAIKAFTKQSDRGSALVAAAWVDDALEFYLRSYFRPNKKSADRVLQPEGPLGTFSARISVAYLLRLISRDARDDMEIIRRIRNDFAHVRLQIRFSDQNIKDRCKRLNAAKAFQLGTDTPIRSPRQMFLISAYFLSEYLLSLSNYIKPSRSLDIVYTGPIRRFAKSMILSRIRSVFEGLEKVGGG